MVARESPQLCLQLFSAVTLHLSIPQSFFSLYILARCGVIYSISAKCGLKNTMAFGNLGGNWGGVFQINCSVQMEYIGDGEAKKGGYWLYQKAVYRQCLGGENDRGNRQGID